MTDQLHENEDDATFGMADKDWDVYLEMQRNKPEGQESLEEQLAAINTKIFDFAKVHKAKSQCLPYSQRML